MTNKDHHLQPYLGARGHACIGCGTDLEEHNDNS